ncbi:MAG: YlxR family protein [Clostridiales bacterium]|nr:YlxR family protein [Clostridiales bacterium]
MKSIPQRMCISCRTMQDKKTLLRIVRDKDGAITLDFKGKKAGRGAYVCDNPDCINKCVKKKLLHKVFGCAVPDEVYGYIGNEYKEECKRRHDDDILGDK